MQRVISPDLTLPWQIFDSPLTLLLGVFFWGTFWATGGGGIEVTLCWQKSYQW